jgi:hypothetical protein
MNATLLPRGDVAAQSVAARYVASSRIVTHPLPFVRKVNATFAGALADWFDDAPCLARVGICRDSYAVLARETLRQLRAIESAGYVVTFVASDPYGSSAAMCEDVAAGRLSVLDSGAAWSHPLLDRDANNAFRAVHDFFGHACYGFQFGPVGEENAYRAHRAMFSPGAWQALCSETRAQNSWVNYGPHAAHNRANPRATIFAAKKATCVPARFVGDYPTTVGI